MITYAMESFKCFINKFAKMLKTYFLLYFAINKFAKMLKTYFLLYFAIVVYRV